MHIFAGLFRLKASNEMGQKQIWFLKKIQTFLKEENHKTKVKNYLSLDKRRVKCSFTIQSLLKQRRSENLVFQKNESKYLDILKMRGGNMQRHLCINECILRFRGNSKSYEVSETKWDHRKLLMQVKKKG